MLRNRYTYFALLIISFGLALFTRLWGRYLPGIIAVYGGDYMSGPMAFALMRILFPKYSTLKLGLVSLLFAWAIEFQQLYKAPWMQAVRSNWLGGLVLGHQFVWSDIVCLTLGVWSAALLEYFWLRYQRTSVPARSN